MNFTRGIHLFAVSIIFTATGFSQMTYSLRFSDSGQKKVSIVIIPAKPLSDSLLFIMPRYVPGGYAVNNYHHYVENIIAITPRDSVLPMKSGNDGSPRWFLDHHQRAVKEISYEVDLGKMEREQADMGSASYARKDFIGVLNYSLFGWIDGTEKEAITYHIKTFTNWPIFSTLSPKEIMPAGNETIECRNYYELADGQTMMGPAMRVKEFKGLRPIFVAEYCETKAEILDNYGKEAVASLELLNDYFGTIPFKHYSVVTWAVVPAKPVTGALLAMEHLSSLTFIGDTTYLSVNTDTGDIKQYLFGILHHMGHAFIPLRCHGDQYKPYPTELPLLIKNIWFNEGFIWFICKELLGRKWINDFLLNGVNREVTDIRKMDLLELSQLASLQYGDDFRIGMATFSRGAMMASEMNEFLIRHSDHRKSMKDVIRYLYSWSQEHKRGFTMDEFPRLLNESTHIDLSSVYKKWLKPLP